MCHSGRRAACTACTVCDGRPRARSVTHTHAGPCSTCPRARLWNGADLKSVRSVANGTSWITDCAYMPQGRRLVVASMDRAISSFDMNRRARPWGHAKLVPCALYVQAPCARRVLRRAKAAAPPLAQALRRPPPLTPRRRPRATRGSYDLTGRVYTTGTMGTPLCLHVLAGEAGERVIYGDSEVRCAWGLARGRMLAFRPDPVRGSRSRGYGHC